MVSCCDRPAVGVTSVERRIFQVGRFSFKLGDEFGAATDTLVEAGSKREKSGSEILSWIGYIGEPGARSHHDKGSTVLVEMTIFS